MHFRPSRYLQSTLYHMIFQMRLNSGQSRETKLINAQMNVCSDEMNVTIHN